MPAKTTKTVAPTQTDTTLPKGKLGLLIRLLQRPEGASLAEMTEVTGWQNHSVRGAIAGTIKKKLGLPVTTAKTEGALRYQIAQAA